MFSESVKVRAPSMDVLPFLNFFVSFDGHSNAMNMGRKIDERVLGIPAESELRGSLTHISIDTV